MIFSVHVKNMSSFDYGTLKNSPSKIFYLFKWWGILHNVLVNKSFPFFFITIVVVSIYFIYVRNIHADTHTHT